jgi:putative ABC transport system permease protein
MPGPSSKSNEELGFWRERARTLDGITAIAPGWLMALVAEGGEPLKITGARVGDDFFTLLGTGAAVGRTLVPGDGIFGREHVAVIADGLWRQRFGGDPGVIGRSVLVDQVAHELVGVMPPDFEVLGQRTELWVPLPFAPGTSAHRTSFSRALGRLRAGATAAAASRELASLVPEMRRTLGRPDDWGRALHAASLQDTTTRAVRPALTLLLTAVGLVLLLAAANLGTLVLGRSIERARELAVRTAIGASRRQLVRQLLVEQIVLAAAGALAGLALAQALLPILVARLPPEVPRQTEIALDGGVFLAVLAASVGLAVAMALPALVALRAGVQPLLRQRHSTGTPGRQRALGGLVAAQVALALVLGVGAGLMLRSMWNLQRVDPGFDPDGVLAFRVQTTSKYRSLGVELPYLQQARERLAALPGVTAVGAIGHLPMSRYSWSIGVHRQDRPLAPGAGPPEVGWRFVWGDYFEAMRIPLVAGRRFTSADRTGALLVAVINESMARAFFGDPAAALG